jgi:hypothetical protein
MRQTQVLDFGKVKFVAPAKALTPGQWSNIRTALSLAGRDLLDAAELLIEGAGLLVWPERKRRTTRPWSAEDIAFVLANYAKMDSYRLGASIGRSSTAVEYFLAQRDLQPMRLQVVKKREYTRAPYCSANHAAHLAAVFSARGRGFAR